MKDDWKYHECDKQVSKQVKSDLLSKNIKSYPAVCQHCDGTGRSPTATACNYCDGNGSYELQIC